MVLYILKCVYKAHRLSPGCQEDNIQFSPLGKTVDGNVIIVLLLRKYSKIEELDDKTTQCSVHSLLSSYIWQTRCNELG